MPVPKEREMGAASAGPTLAHGSGNLSRNQSGTSRGSSPAHKADPKREAAAERGGSLACHRVGWVCWKPVHSAGSGMIINPAF